MKKFVKPILWIILSIGLLLIITVSFINSHWGINIVKNIALNKINKIPGMAIGLSDIQMNIFGKVTVKDVEIKSKTQDIYCEDIVITFSPISLAKKQIRDITIIRPEIKIKPMNKIAGKSKKEKMIVPNITLKKFSIKGGEFNFQNYHLRDIALSGSILNKNGGLSINLNNLMMRYENIPVEMGISAFIDTMRNIQISNMELSTKNSIIFVSGSISDREINSKIKGNIDIEEFSSFFTPQVMGKIIFNYSISGDIRNPEIKGNTNIKSFQYKDIQLENLSIYARVKDKEANLTVQGFNNNALSGNIIANFNGDIRGMFTLNKFDASLIKKGISSSINGKVHFNLSRNKVGNFSLLLSPSRIQQIPISYVKVKMKMNNNVFNVDTLLVQGKGLGVSVEGTASKDLANLTISADSLKLGNFADILKLPLKGNIHSEIAVIGNIKSPSVVGNLWGRDIGFKNIKIPYFEMGISANNVIKALQGDVNIKLKDLSIGKLMLNNLRLLLKGARDTLDYRITGNYIDKTLLITGISQVKKGGARIDTFKIADSLGSNITNPKPAFFNISKGKIFIDKFILNGPGSNIGIWGNYSTNNLNLVADIAVSDIRRLAGWMKLKKIVKGDGEIILNLSGTLNKPEMNISGWINSFVYEDAKYDSIRIQMDYRDNIFNLTRLNMYYKNRVSEIYGYIPIVLSLSGKKHIVITKKPMDVKINVQDLGIWPFASFKSIMDIYKGKISLKANAKGRLDAPIIKGNVGIDSMGIYLNTLGTKITDIKGNVKFDNKSVLIGPINGRTRTGKFYAKGKIKLDKFRPKTMDIKTKLTRLPIQGIEYVDALIDADIGVKGKMKSPLVSGKVNISKAIISMPFKKKEGGSVASAKSPVKLHIKVAMPGNVWIRNDFADMELSGNITIKKDRTLKIDGEAGVVDGYFYYFDKPFKVEKGKFRFQGGEELNPSIDLIARTEVRMQKENQENITGNVVLVVGGTMLAPTFDLHTEPPLPPLELKDIIPLLNINMTWEQIASFQKMSSALSSKALTYLIRTQLLSRVQSTVGIDALDLQANLFGENKSTKITLGKYITRNIYASYTKDILAKSPDQFKVQYFIKRYGTFTTERDDQGRYWAGIELNLNF